MSRTISQKDLKKHYYKLARKYHPDIVDKENKEEAEKYFQTITEAYNALSTVESRRRYDMGGMRANIVYSNGFGSTVSRRQQILAKLREKRNFSIQGFAFELKVSYNNLEKILVKFIGTLEIKARIENGHVYF